MEIFRLRPALLATAMSLAAVLASGAARAEDTAMGNASTDTAGMSASTDAGMAAMETGDLEWGDMPPGLPAGAQFAVLSGDPAKSGPFTVRIKADGAYAVPPHMHSMIENVTVLEGTLHVGHGDKMEKTAAQEVTTGGYFSVPAGENHYVWSDGPALIQVSGDGPFDITYVNPSDDPRNATKMN